MASYRSDETEAKYVEHAKAQPADAPCPICAKPSIKEFAAWRVTANEFPYDKIARDHQMLVPKRHIAETDVTNEEWLEFNEIKRGFVNDNYDLIMERTQRTKTVPAHCHFHLINIK